MISHLAIATRPDLEFSFGDHVRQCGFNFGHSLEYSLFQKPPFDDSPEGVLGITALGQVAKNPPLK
jgi:hypothetical protein